MNPPWPVILQPSDVLLVAPQHLGQLFTAQKPALPLALQLGAVDAHQYPGSKHWCVLHAGRSNTLVTSFATEGP